MIARRVVFTVSIPAWPHGRCPPEHAVGALIQTLRLIYNVEATVEVCDPQRPPLVSELVNKETAHDAPLLF